LIVYSDMDGFEVARRDVKLQSEYVTYLKHLKDSGFEPKVIYDIGALVCHFADVAKELWPDAKIVLFDALEKCETYFVQSGYTDYHIGVLTDSDDKQVSFYKSDVHPGGSSYYQEVGNWLSHIHFREETAEEKTGMTLDTVVSRKSFPPPDLVKLDVQGCEKDIIQGGQKTIESAKVLLVEMQHAKYNDGAPMVTETLPFIESLGFTCVAPKFCDNPKEGDYSFFKTGFSLM